MNRFADTNKLNLQKHFKGILESAMNYYKEKKADIRMPLDEDELKKQHLALS